MLQVKRWAKQYLSLSPVFKHKVFGLPNNQHIMRVNPRLLTAYCLNMLKHKHYDQHKVASILQMYNDRQNCYWNNYVRSIIDQQKHNTKMQPSEMDSGQGEGKQGSIEKIHRLRYLISKTYHQQIDRSQFTQLAQLYLILLEQQSITQMDNFVIDLSLYQLTHLTTFADMKQSALPAIGHQSIALLQTIIGKGLPVHYFAIISVLNRVHSKLDNYPQLQLLAEWVKPQSNHRQLLQQNANDRLFLTEQSIVFMVWLMQMHQLGEFMYYHIRKNYLLMEYYEHSLKLVGRLLILIEIDNNMQKRFVVLLSEVVSRVQLMQQERDIFEQLEQGVQLQKTLNRLKNKINHLSEKDRQQTIHSNKMQIDILQQLNQYEIDFHSTYSHRFIKQQLLDIIANPYSSILLNHAQIDCLFELGYKIGNAEIHIKLVNKFKKREQTNNSQKLIDYLTNMNNQQRNIDVLNLSIDNICQLSRVKHQLSTKTSQTKSKPQQLSHLDKLRLLLTNPKHQTDLQLLTRLLRHFEL